MAEVEDIGQAGMSVCLLHSDGVKLCSAKCVCYSVMHLWYQLTFEKARGGSINEQCT